MSYKLHILEKIVCLVWLQLAIASAFPQTSSSMFIYDRQGNKIVYECQDKIIHMGFSREMTMSERTALIEDITDIADYYMLPDSSYCFMVNSGYEKQFKTKVFANSHVAYFQNEFRDSLGGVVWGTMN